MYYKVILSTIGLLFLFVGCHDKICHQKKMPFYPLLPIMEKYFGNYKPDNYWIYLNQDSTKRDSIFVSNFEYERMKEPVTLCLELESKIFNLESSYLSAEKKLDVAYTPKGSCCINSFNITSKAIDFAVYIEGREAVDSLMIPAGVSGLSINRVYNYILKHNAQLPLSEVTIVHRPKGEVVFAPNLGIVQYLTNYYQDTFTLVKYHIQ